MSNGPYWTIMFLPVPTDFVSPIFGDHMVLQRDRENVIWGWTKPGSTVSIRIAGIRAAGKAQADGKWTVRFKPPRTGGPYSMEIEGPEKRTLKDILVGDVWICSGQSNMEMGVTMVANAQAEIAAANHPQIRLYQVEHATSFKPVATPVGSWAVCSPATIGKGGWGGFSATAYFFGRELQRDLKVPIGLVQTCWGGTIAEAWTSKQGLSKMKDFEAPLRTIDEWMKNSGSYCQQIDEWARANDAGSKAGYEAERFDDSAWSKAVMPNQFEKIGLADFDGVLWVRTKFALSNAVPSGDAVLTLGGIDDIDTTWINGKQVGFGGGVSIFRQYPLPKGTLKAGENTIAIRILDTGWIGGFNHDASNFNLRIGDKTFPLAGEWRYTKEAELKSSSPVPANFEGNPNLPTALYGGMIAPLVPLSIKGAIWYQGESNAGRAMQYRTLMPTLVQDWRRVWGQGYFPFYLVQLAGFQGRQAQPGEDAWAELREAQYLTTKAIPNVGMATAIDIGESNDIHPHNKQEVGRRLALEALRKTYGRKIESSGPVLKSWITENGSLRVKFDHAKGLQSKGKLEGFAIAGADKKFVWADAKIEGESVVLSSPLVRRPIYVRYAWDSYPPTPLYNGAGLPAIPFRNDGP